MTLHFPVKCSVRDCRDEASWWIADIGGRETFYLCSEHNPESADGLYHVINHDRTITTREVGGYSCNDTCKDCNPLIED